MLATYGQVKPFLGHERKILREHAVGYFARSFSRDPDLVPLILQSCRMYGEEENLLLLAYAGRFPQTEFTLQAVLDRLPHVTNVIVIRHFNHIIANADIDVLMNMAPNIRKVTNMAPGCLSRIKKRIDLFMWPTNKLMNELLAFCHRNEDKSLADMDYSYGKDIVKTLVTRDDLPLDTVLTILTDKNYHGYEELYMIFLAGELKMVEVIPLLIDNIRLNEEMLSQESVGALTKIGSDIVVRAMQQAFFTGDWMFRFSASTLLANIKSPASEQAFLDLFPKETDISVQSFMAHEWCNLLSDQCIPYIMDLIGSGYDRDITSLEESLYCACKIMDIHLPEMEEWEQEITDNYEDNHPQVEEFLRAMNIFLPKDPFMWPLGNELPKNKRSAGGSRKKSKKRK